MGGSKNQTPQTLAEARRELIALRSNYDEALHRIASLEEQVDDSIDVELHGTIESQLIMTEVQIVEAIIEALDAKDPYTQGHSRRVAELSVLMGAALKLGRADMWGLHLGALLHDVGKIGVSGAALRKSSGLTEEELEQLRYHPVKGSLIVGKVESFSKILPIVRSHHERWDGQGYPDQLAGEEIPIGAAIVGVADAFDAMTSQRTYNVAMPQEEGLREIEKHSGTQFNPIIVDALCRVLKPKTLSSLSMDKEMSDDVMALLDGFDDDDPK